MVLHQLLFLDLGTRWTTHLVTFWAVVLAPTQQLHIWRLGGGMNAFLAECEHPLAGSFHLLCRDEGLELEHNNVIDGHFGEWWRRTWMVCNEKFENESGNRCFCMCCERLVNVELGKLPRHGQRLESVSTVIQHHFP